MKSIDAESVAQHDVGARFQRAIIICILVFRRFFEPAAIKRGCFQHHKLHAKFEHPCREGISFAIITL